MPAFALRFVGQEALPPRLSEFDLEQFFSLTSEGVTAIRAQFRSDQRLPAALMLLFMRVAGRPLACCLTKECYPPVVVVAGPFLS